MTKQEKIRVILVLSVLILILIPTTVGVGSPLSTTTTTTTATLSVNSTSIPTTFVSQTTGVVTVSSATAVAQCTILQIGSVISKTTGSVAVSCPSTGAIAFPTSTPEIPVFSLPSGFTNVTIQSASTIISGCTQNFIQQNGLNFVKTGQFLKSTVPLSFVASGTNSTTTIPNGLYDYCLWYTNPPSVFSFTISWSP